MIGLENLIGIFRCKALKICSYAIIGLKVYNINIYPFEKENFLIDNYGFTIAYTLLTLQVHCHEYVITTPDR